MKENIKQKKNESNIFRQKKVLQIIIVILSLIVLILSLITLASTVRASNLAFGRYRFYIMKSQSQSDIAKVGDLLIARKPNSGEVKVEDSIVYKDNNIYYCDKVVEINKTNIVNKVILTEKDGVKYQFNESDISGKVIKRINNLGNITLFLITPIGIIFFILFLICLFAVLRIMINYNKDNT